MNILYLTDTGNIIGGGEISLLNLLENINQSKFNPHVVMPQSGDFTEKVKQLGVGVNILELKKVKNPLNIFFSLRRINRLCGIIKQQKIGLIHSNSTGGIAFLGGMAARIMKIPFIWHVRIINSAGPLDIIQCVLSTKIIVISEAVEKRFWWIPVTKKIVTIYNGVNTDNFKEQREMNFRDEIGCKEDDFLVGTIGRFIPLKGYEYFIKAAKIILEKAPNAKFLIVGLDYDKENRYLSYLKKLTRDLELKDKIIFLGEREDVPQILSSLDVFVFTSIGESFGRVLIEAMGCAKPVVAFRSGGVPEIVEEGLTGFLVSPKDSRKMAEKIIYLLNNKEIRQKIGQAGRLRAERLFDIKAHVKRVEDLYLSLIKNEDSS